MKKEYLTEAMNAIRDDQIEEAITGREQRRRHIRLRRALSAAGLALVVLAGLLIWRIADSQTLSVKAADLMKGIRAEAVEAGEMTKEARTALSDLSLRLFQAGIEEKENTLISPLSVLNALGMTANGAAGTTKEQMEEVFGMSVEELNRYLYLYRQSLPGSGKNQIHLANSVWFTDSGNLKVNMDFLQTNANWYDAAAYQAPFNEDTRQDINDWINENTEGRIPEMIDEIPKDAVMYLVNALTFDAEWEECYQNYQVTEGTFTDANGTEETVEMMNSQEFCYLEDDNATGVMKYYAGKEYAFLALLPKEEMTAEEYAATLDGEHLTKLISGRKEIAVNTAIPKFYSEYAADLKDALIQLGMPDAFNVWKADFSVLGSTQSERLCISSVQHRTMLEVGEQGTKAAAATVVEATDAGGIVEEYREVIFDRPFLYMIIDCENQLPVFVGILNHVD